MAYVMTVDMLASRYTVVQKFFDRKYFIDKKIQDKILSWIHDFLEIFLP